MLFVLTLLVMLFPAITLAADPDFKGNAAFLAKWQRTDKPVADGKTSRSWVWGPSVTQLTTEPYAESPGGSRQVVYLDKARMELNDPAKNQVSNGLLVKEMVGGQLALGDTKTQAKAAAEINVAGDPGNPGPTYASFRKVSTINNTDNNATNRQGQAVDDTLARDGATGKNAALGLRVKYAYFDSSLKHNVPDVFADYMNQKGTIWDGSKFVDNQQVFDAVDAMGLPISEAYWSQVVVGGQPKDVLIQAFERRVLTYTPSNPTAFQVEMGNVGQHYLSWRNGGGSTPGPVVSTTPAAPGSTPPPSGGGGTPAPEPSSGPPGTPPVPSGTGSFACTVNDIPKDNYALVLSKCGPAGFQQIGVGIGFKAGENLQVFIKSASGAPVGTAQSLQASPLGIINTRIDVPLNANPGLYSLNFVGSESAQNSFTYFKVTASLGTTSIALLPDAGSIGDPFVAMIVGFSPGEKLTISYTNPNGENIKTATPDQTASNTGGYTELFSPKYAFTNPKLGTWSIVAKSVDNPGKSATATFTLS